MKTISLIYILTILLTMAGCNSRQIELRSSGYAWYLTYDASTSNVAGLDPALFSTKANAVKAAVDLENAIVAGKLGTPSRCEDDYQLKFTVKTFEIKEIYPKESNSPTYLPVVNYSFSCWVYDDVG